MDKYDVIVVGGSVAGASTAMLIARRGHKVLLVDRQQFPRDTNSTHFIWPRGMSYLKRWGVEEQLRGAVPYCRDMEINVEGISLVGSVPATDLERRFTGLHGDAQRITDLYAGPRRYFIDNLLLESAQEAGVDVRQGFTFDQVLTEDDAVVGIEGRSADGVTTRAYAKLVIGADGRHSVVAERVGAHYIDYRPLSTFAYYGYFSGISHTQLAIHKKGRLGTAIFPTMDDTHMVLVYGPNAWWEEFRKQAETNFLYTYDYCAPDVAEKIASGIRVEPFKSCGSMPAFKRKGFGKGWVLVGDACSFKDQVSAMGMTHAFRDAELLSQYIDRVLVSARGAVSVLEEYAELRASDYDDYFNLVCKVAEMNPYTREEIEHLYSIRNDQASINALISQFGDTRPVKDNAPETDAPDEAYPAAIRGYDTVRRQYDVNIYTRNNLDTAAFSQA